MIAIALIVGTLSCGGGGGAVTYGLTMAAAPGGGGTATDLTNTSPYAAGTVVSIKAVANPGYKLVSWSAPAGTFGSATAATTTFTMPAQNVTVTANFVPVYNLTMAVNPVGGGTATDLTNASPYAAGTVVSIKAVANPAYRFVSWTAPAGTFASATAAQTTFTMPAQAVTVTANFVPVYSLTMAVNPVGGGTASDLTNASPYPAGTVVSIKAVAAAPYQFVSWTAPAGTFGNATAATTTFTMPAQDVIVTANFVGPLDHFIGYLVDSETYIGENVTLEDQFGAVNATVEWALGFCNPAEKVHGEVTTPIWNPDHHFTLYTLSYEGEPRTWQVEVMNQFGTQNLTVSGPFALAVPTQKAGHEPPVGLDHYLIYMVDEGPLVEEIVDLNDEFGPQPGVLVYEPVLFANPVQKTHDGAVTEIVNPETHAVIYSIAGGYLEREVQVVNQFGQQTLNVSGPYMLAVPSEKLSFAPVLFDDQFDEPTLSPDWVISPGKGSYSLTDNPGYLRYIIDAWGWVGGAVPLQLIRPFSGEQWILTAAITYNMRPAEPTNNRNMHFFIRTPGPTGTTLMYTYRSVGVNDGNPASNMMALYVGDNSTGIYFPNSPDPLPLERWYFEIERNEDYIALRASNDGDDSTFEYEVEYTFPSGVLGNDQEIVIQGSGWWGSNDPPGWADFDFIKANAI